MTQLRIVEVADADVFARLPPCSNPSFDHRTCDYWEDADRGLKTARVSWLSSGPAATRPQPPVPDNPFAPAPRERAPNPFEPESLAASLDPLAGDDLFATPAFNPFAPQARRERPMTSGVPRKLALLDRGRGVFGAYAKVLLDGEIPVAYAQFGPLSAYPRAGRLRELYPRLPQSPPPAVITCVSTTADARHRGHGQLLVADVCRDLSERGFAAVEAYPDLTLPSDETSAARTGFWLTCGFALAIDDPRFPVVRRELE